MTIVKQSRMLSRALICATVLMLAAFAAESVRAQQDEQAAGQQRLNDATRSLFDAVQANDLAAVQASIAAGGNLSAKDQWGLTPIDLAIDKSYFDVAHFLLSVRNFQRAENAPRGATAARPSVAAFGQQSPSAAKDRGGARSTPREAVRAAPAETSRQTLTERETRRNAVEKWPADQPNPFDPKRPAPGAALPGDGIGEMSRSHGHTAAVERPQVQ